MNESSPEAPPPTLAQQLASGFAGMRVEIGGVRTLATQVGHLHPATAEKMTDILQRLMTLATQVTSMETVVSAKQAVGDLGRPPRQVPHAELELMAISADTRQRMRETLHRVADDSLDETGGKS